MIHFLFLILFVNSSQAGSIEHFPDVVKEDAFNFTGYIIDIGMGKMKTYGLNEVVTQYFEDLWIPPGPDFYYHTHSWSYTRDNNTIFPMTLASFVYTFSQDEGRDSCGQSSSNFQKTQWLWIDPPNNKWTRNYNSTFGARRPYNVNVEETCILTDEAKIKSCWQNVTDILRRNISFSYTYFESIKPIQDTNPLRFNLPPRCFNPPIIVPYYETY